MFVESADYLERVLRKIGDSVSRFTKRIQYVLFILMVCLMLALPAVAMDALDGTSANQTGDTIDEAIYPTAASSATLPEDVTVDLPEPPAQTLGVQAVKPVVLFEGTLALTDGTFDCTASSGGVYTVENQTPLGALQKVSELKGFLYAVTDKKWVDKGVLLLDDVSEYTRDNGKWVCYVNGVEKDGFKGHDEGLNIIALTEGDEVVFCYGKSPTPDDAEALIKIAVDVEDSDETPVQPTTWSIKLKGALTDTVNQDFFERGIAHGHVATYIDDEFGDEWAGMPLWYLVGLVDDEQGHGSGTFNEALAEKGYSIKITSNDGYSINFDSRSVAKNDDIIVANTFNGEPLPETIGEKEKPCWPLQMVGKDVTSGQKVGGVATIELVGLPDPSEDWEITLEGAFTRTVSREEFEDWTSCHSGSYTDSKNRVWTGIPLRYLVGAVDDVESSSHWKFNEARAAEGYTVRVTAADGFSATFEVADIAKDKSFIVADRMNGTTLEGDEKNWPLKFVGPGLSEADQVGGIASIALEGLPGESTESEWTLTLEGPKITYIVTKEEFEDGEACPHHTKTYSDGVSTWTGIPLKALCGWVDDDVMHGSGAFDTILAQTGYTVIVSSGGESPYSKEFSSKDILENPDDYIIASKINGTAITDKNAPLRLVGKGAAGSLSVGNVQRIQLVDFQKPTESPSIRIIKYASDGKTIESETTKTCEWMEKNLDVIGGESGIRLRFQGPTFDPNDLWNPEEDINLGKVDEIVRGTAIRDLCDLVGGAAEGNEIELIASDGYKAVINYTNVYTPLERQGEAFVAWWAERQGYVPDYRDGPRLFYNAPDGVFGADDMRTCLAEVYWHYYHDSGIQYPSAAGVSNKNIATIAIKPDPRKDWTLTLTGAITETIDRSYFESGKACSSMAGSHSATWTDDEGHVWSGVPLWLLCGWVDDENKHDYGTSPFRDDLADEGYNITVIDYGTDGIKGTDDDFSYTLNSSFVKRNNNIIVADEVDGAPLEGKNWPLKLVGSALTSNKQKVGGIDEIELSGEAIVVIPTIPLKTGWNFVSVPKVLSAGSDTAAIFSGVNREGHSIWQYDAAIKDWKRVEDTDRVRPLEGYWIYSAGNDKVLLRFDTDVIRTPPAKMLARGWNAIGFTDTEPATTRDTLLSLGDTWTQVIGYDASTQHYETSIIRGGSGNHIDSQEMLPMKGYWVYLRGESELAAIGA